MKKSDELKKPGKFPVEADPFDLHDAPPLNEHGEDWRQELWLLEQSTSAKEFYSRLGTLIRSTGKFSESERDFLAQQAEIPWTKTRGRPREDNRNFEIFMRYILDYEGSRSGAIKEIMKKYNLDFEAAQKAFSKAKKTDGQSTPIDRVQIARKAAPRARGKKAGKINSGKN
jgi:hypothetical protein